MLVLTRRIGEKLIIDECIEIIVLEVQGNNRVKLGITAPQDVNVRRAELTSRQRKEVDNDQSK